MMLTSNKPLLSGLAVVVAGALGWLAFGYFGIQAAFIDERVDEAGPVFTAAVTTTTEQDEVAAGDEFQDADAEADAEASTADEPMPDEPGSASGIVTLFEGDFAGQSGHTTSGRALVLNDGSEQRFLRFESFESTNGPDLKVYLRADDGAFVSLGALKGNIGDQNYEIPTDVDLTVFDTVEIWCERFAVGFGSAPLA
jgi:hypothetical protein